jgi:hypothetical protein
VRPVQVSLSRARNFFQFLVLIQKRYLQDWLIDTLSVPNTRMSSRRMQDESGHARADLVRCLCPTWLVHEWTLFEKKQKFFKLTAYGSVLHIGTRKEVRQTNFPISQPIFIYPAPNNFRPWRRRAPCRCGG